MTWAPSEIGYRVRASSTPTRPGPRRVRLVVLCAALPAGLLACEIALRCLGIAPLPYPRTRGDLVQASTVPGLDYENRPGATLWMSFSATDASEAAPRAVVHRVNEQGFRGAVVSRERAPGSLRIACVGDSHTFGQGVADDETWPAQLEARLRQRMPGRRVEVVNCGVSGYDTRQELAWIRHRLPELQPDLVLLQYFVNDTASRGQAERESDFLQELSHPRRTGFVRRVRDHSRLADVVLDALFRHRELARYVELRGDDSDPGWRDVEESLRAARDDLEGRRVGFAVLMFPLLVRRGEHLATHAAFARLGRFCAAEGIPYLDAESAFLGVAIDDLRLASNDYHAGAEAYEIFADTADRWLAARDL